MSANVVNACYSIKIISSYITGKYLLDMRNLILPAFLLLSLLITGCSDNVALKFGSGGGFTGQYIEYILENDRTIHKNNSLTNESEAIGKITKSELRSIRTAFDDNGIEKLEYDKPGNMSKYIEFKKGEEVKKWQWAEGDENEPAQKLETVYQLLQNLIKE